MVVSTVGCVVIGVCCTYCCALWHGLAGVDISFLGVRCELCNLESITQDLEFREC